MSIFAALAALAPTAAKVAALLGISRQAYSQAVKRGRLSESVTLRASALLGLDPGAALLANASTSRPAPPIFDPSAHPGDNAICNTNYANPTEPKKSRDGQEYRHNAGGMNNAHVIDLRNDPTTETALDIVRWCLSVAHLRPDSPRFAYYVSRWDVPNKIARAKTSGSFDSLTADAGPIDPGWLRLVPSALAEWRRLFRVPDSDDITTASCHNTATGKQLSNAA